MEGVRRLVDAGIPVIVGTGAQNTRLAAAHAAHAKEVGAHGLMVIPRVLSRGSSPAAQRHHFAAILEAGGDLVGDANRGVVGKDEMEVDPVPLAEMAVAQLVPAYAFRRSRRVEPGDESGLDGVR